MNSLKQEISDILKTLDSPKAQSSVNKGEYYLLKRNYNSLVDTLKDQEQTKSSQEETIQNLKNELEELKTSYELHTEDLNLHNKQLKHKLKLVQSAEVAPIVEMYELEIQKLNSKIKTLRNEVVTHLDTPTLPGDSQSLDEAQIMAKKHHKQLKELTQTVKKLQNEVNQKEQELEELKKQQRKWNMNRKCLETVSKRSDQLQGVVEQQAKVLRENQETHQEMSQEIQKLQTQNQELKKELEEIAQHNYQVSEELKVMRDIASTAGMASQTYTRIHKNLTASPKHQGRFAVNLIQRLQKDLSKEYSDQKLLLLVENIKMEVESVYESLEQGQTREQNLLTMLVDLQEKVNDGKSNRVLRNNLMSVLSV